MDPRLDYKTAAFGTATSSSSAATATAAPDIKHNAKKVITSVSATQFYVPSLQNMIGEQLLSTKFKGNLQNLLNYIKSDEKISDPIRELMKGACRRLLVRNLSQAVIDDDGKTVKMILDFEPKLLLIEPASENIKEIESKKTWQRFLTEKPFIMAQKLERLEMTKLMLPYFDNLAEIDETNASDAKNDNPEIVKQWVIPEPLDQKLQEQKDKKLQDDYIKDYFDALITTIAADQSAKVEWVLNQETNFKEARIEINDNTKKALQTFREIVLPDKAIAIESLDIEQLLIAADRAYDKHFDTFQNWQQRNVYAVLVFGFIQSLVGPELAKVYCEGLNDVVNKKKPIGALASEYKLVDGRSFYLAGRDSLSGVGRSFFVDIYGGCWGGWPRHLASWLESYVRQERQSLANLRSSFCARQSLKLRP